MAYHRDNLRLDLLGERDELRVYGEVELADVSRGMAMACGGVGRTEVRSSAMLIVCWARVIFAVLYNLS